MDRREFFKFPAGLALLGVSETFGKDLDKVQLASPLEVTRFAEKLTDDKRPDPQQLRRRLEEEEKLYDSLWWDVNLHRFGNKDLSVVHLHIPIECPLEWHAYPGNEILFAKRTRRLAAFKILTITL